MELAGKAAVVTGGAVRVGKAIALALARRGMRVGITYLGSVEAAAETARELEALAGASAACGCDQRRPEQIDAALAHFRRELGPVAVLVNSAAVFGRTPLDGCCLEDWDRHLEVNLRGPWLFCQGVAAGMRERGEGAIVNLADIAAERPFPSYLPYSASKAGLVALTRGLATALAPAVRVNAIAPGTVLWPDGFPEEQQRHVLAKTPMGRPGTPEDIAAAAVYLAEADYVTGVVLPVDGGRTAAP